LHAIVPPGKRGALLVVVEPGGGQLRVAAALDDDGDWKLGADVRVWEGDVSGKVLLAGSW
jgi:hypothetical protein